MGNENEYTFTFKADNDAIKAFEKLTAAPVEELFDECEDFTVSKEVLIFEAGLNEAARRLLRKHDDYGLIKMVRTILDVEYEGEEE